jgi:hypothetical protein
MPDFETYLARHGEFAIQAIIERLERDDGVSVHQSASLEERWNTLMQDSPSRSNMVP